MSDSYRIVRAAGGRIDHVDVTIICEAPKIGPHRPAIRARIAELLELEEGQISVKATTTEKLGFTGRGEGIAAQAVTTVLFGPCALCTSDMCAAVIFGRYFKIHSGKRPAAPC